MLVKIIFLYNFLISSNFNSVGLREFWLHSGIQYAELFDDSYQVFRIDHYIDQTKLGRGLLLGVKTARTKCIMSQLLDFFEFGNIMCQTYNCL